MMWLPFVFRAVYPTSTKSVQRSSKGKFASFRAAMSLSNSFSTLLIAANPSETAAGGDKDFSGERPLPHKLRRDCRGSWSRRDAESPSRTGVARETHALPRQRETRRHFIRSKVLGCRRV